MPCSRLFAFYIAFLLYCWSWQFTRNISRSKFVRERYSRSGVRTWFVL